MINKEYGSDFHYHYENQNDKTISFFNEDFSFFFSGRVALYNLLESGIKKFGWKKVGFPSYYCHEVVEYCKKLPIEIEYYLHNPLLNTVPDWQDEMHNVFINVDFFGIKKLNTDFLGKSIIIEDLTHNLLSVKKSKAHYCFGSLRKQLPVATGGFVYHNGENLEYSNELNEFSNKVALTKLAAMFLKSEYLNGNFEQKDIYREMFLQSEEKFKLFQTNTKMPQIIESQLFSLFPEDLVYKTYDNIRNAKKLIHHSEKISLIQTSQNTEMGLLFICESNDLRNQLKLYLINNKVFPAILWPEQFNAGDIDLQDRILFVHVDFRYEKIDIESIVKIINKFIGNV